MADGVEGSGLNRRDLLRNGAAGAFALSTAGLLAACGAGSGASGQASSGASRHSGSALSSGPPSGGTPVKGGTLTAGFVTGGSAETIDPRKALVNGDLARCYSLYDTLFKQIAGGRYSAGIAVDASANKSFTKWKFKLRRGVKWHDGQPFTADDVVYTIRRNWGTSANLGHAGYALIIDFAGVRKIDDLTVEVPLHHGVTDFPVICTGTNLWVVQNGTTKWTNGVGTGPYVFKSYTPGSQSVFTANQDYWDGPPHLDTLIVNSSFSSDNARFNALQAGDIDIAPQVPQALAKANAASGKIVLGNQPAPGFIAPTMHVSKPPFTDVRVRQALRLLANREETVSNVFDGYATAGNDCAGQTLRYWASQLHRTPDPERAKSLLKSAGHQNLAVDLYTADLVPGVNESATLYAQQATAGGVTVHIKTVDPATYYTPASPGGAYPNKPFSMNQWALGMPSLSYVYLVADVPGAPFNETGWGGGSANNLLYDAMGEGDPTKAADKWLAVQEMQFNQGGYIIMANITFLDGYSPKVRGVQTTSAGPCNNYDFSKAWLS